MADKEAEVEESAARTWLGAPVAKLPANRPAAMCVVVGNETVWVLDRHAVLLPTAGGPNEDCDG